jgi:hypothetical protein
VNKSKNKDIKNELYRKQIEWLRRPILSLCFFIAYKRLMGRIDNIREIRINEELKDILYSFLPKGYSFRLSLEESYSFLIKDPLLQKEYKALLKKKNKKYEALDILIESKRLDQSRLFIEVKRYITEESRSEIEKDISKVKTLLDFCNTEDNLKSNPKARGFVLVVSQKELPAFIVDSEKFVSVRGIIHSEDNNFQYRNRITCKVISSNIGHLNLNKKTENKDITGIYACLLEVL